MTSITFIGSDGTSRSVRIKSGTSIMEAAIDGDIPGIEAQCYGAGVCGTCHVYALEPMRDTLPPRSEWEIEMLAGLELAEPDSRLACQIRFEDAYDGGAFRIPERQDTLG